MDFQIFTSWAEVRNICNPEALPAFQNEQFSLNTQSQLPNTVFVWKQQTGDTLLNLLDEATAGTDGKAAQLARQLYQRDYQDALQARKEEGGEMALSLLSCFEDPDFIGAVWFRVPVEIHQKDRFGTPFYTENSTFQASLVRVDGPAIAGREGECTLRGCILGENQESPSDQPFQAKAIRAFFSQTELTLVTGESSLLPYGLFDQSGLGWEAMDLCGVYRGGTYQYHCCNTVNYPIMGVALRSVSVETMAVTTLQQGNSFILVLKCGGKLRFQLLDTDFDPFSYGPLDVDTDGFVDYSNLQITVRPGEAVEFSYRQIVLQEEGAVVRAGSLLEQFPHGTPEFLCFQNGTTPETLGYHRIQCPATQSKLEAHWYGLAVPLTLCGGVQVKLLFAFGETSLYVGSNLTNGGISAGLTFPLNELFEVHCTTIALLSCPQPDGRKVATLYLKGIRVSLFGLTFPPDACSIVFLAQGSTQPPGWYAVYGQRREA